MDVGSWLRSLGLGQYEDAFRDNKIAADLLPRLTDAGLKDVGVSALGDRLRLLDAIAALAGPKPPADVPAFRSELRPPNYPVVSAERRPITVMFCDLVGSTSLAAKLDAEDWRNLVNAYLDEATKAVTGLGGHVLKRLGDGLMALFGYPHAQENDAERAVRAALAIQRALSDLNARNAAKNAPELSARIGIEAGSVVVEATGEVFGDAPNVAARVQAIAEPGSVLVTMNVQRQVAGLFVAEEQSARELKGLPQPVQLFRIIRASGARRRSSGRSLTPFVGREEELGQLARRWERAKGGEGQLALIVGEPGLGKSRLIEEFHTRLAEAPHTWVEWSASQLLQNTPLHPIAEWGRLRFGADAPAEQRLADLEGTLRLIGLDPVENAPLLAPLVDVPLPPARAANFLPEELRRRQLAAMTNMVLAGARSQPAVVAFEDLHWADPTSLDLLRALADRGAQAPLLLLATTRPEFRAPWSLRSHHSLISLSPLDRAGVARMVGEISAQRALSKDVIEGVSERTGGVPLFVEEVTRLLLERGEQGGVQAIPPTLQQSLAARLDRLGPAREVAQIGAVLGRDFAYRLLRSVAEIDEPALQSSLERLAEADLLFVEGAPPQASYRFKHALIQDAAYDSLLKTRRQALHRRAAEILRDDPERAAAEPEVIAHHFTQAGLDDLAIEWWGRAGDQALRRSAFQEAIAHLGKAIAMADKSAGAPSRQEAGDAAVSSERLKLQTDYGLAVMWSKGFTAEETKAAFVRSTELAAKSDDFSERFAAAHGQWTLALVRGELQSACELASAFLREAENAGCAVEAGVAHRGLALMRHFAGEFAGARTHCERALDACNPADEESARERFGEYTGTLATASLALTSWKMGEVDRARELIDTANRRAAELGHGPSMANPLYIKSILEILRGDAAAALSAANALEALSREHGMALQSIWAELIASWAHGHLRDPAAGAAKLQRALTTYAEIGAGLDVSFYQGLLAELEEKTLGGDSALARVDDALILAHQVSQLSELAFLHRLRGDILLRRDIRDPFPAEEAYQAAIDIAKKQGARSSELLASLSLAKLYQSTGRPADAHSVLAPAVEGFAPTPEMPEIAEAQALLAALADTDEVKAAEAQRRRLTQLHVSYGNALIAARGYGASETTEAFAKAREAASGDQDAPERPAVDYGLWVSSYVRGELPSMQAHAAAFLSDVGARPESPEAGVAHRAAGMTCWFLGEYREARDHFERALALFQPGRDDDLAFRFGQDAGVAAMFSLAVASWPLGEVHRAISLIDRMQTRIAGLTHVGTLAVGRMHAALFELMRGEHARVAPNVFELVRLAREHDLPMQGAFGVFLEGWATAASGAPAEGLADMRRGVELLREQNVLYFDGLLKIALAEAEARAGDFDRAIAIIDEALATVDRLGYRAFEAELHRAHGEILLKRDPRNPALAKDAFLTAVAVAKQQGTRSFELRAALSLAKMYQSISHPAEAHALLGSALEGFAPPSPSERRAGDGGASAPGEAADTLPPGPSSERERQTAVAKMPEIEEAQALLAALAESDEVKAADAARRRRLKLQTDYGQAMMYSKGYGAEETRTAFADALKIAAGTADAAGRFAAYYGIWAGSLDRGDLTLAQQMAETFRREAEDEAQLPSLARACACRGLTLLIQGDLARARAQLEEALKTYDPAWDRETKLGFGSDVGALASAYLAKASWLLGDVALARELIEQAVAGAIQSEHIPTRVFVYTRQAQLEAVRGDAEVMLPVAETIVELSQDYGLAVYLAWGKTYRGWASARLGDREAGVMELRAGLAGLADQGTKLYVPFYLALLAQIEAETGEISLSRIDEALALAAETGERWSDAFLHRIRGEILLKQDPANAVPAERAFRAAIAVAQAQKARSFELQAALAQAKLYRSTGRPAEAHNVLAPALEGFTPTPEMPEIAEAQALLVAIEAGAHARHE